LKIKKIGELQKMRKEIEPNFELVRQRYDTILKQILAYAHYCDKNGDEDGEKYRELEASLRELTGKDMSDLELCDCRKAGEAKKLAFEIALPYPAVVADVTKDELREIVERITISHPYKFQDEFLKGLDRTNFEKGYFLKFLELNFKNFDFGFFAVIRVRTADILDTARRRS